VRTETNPQFVAVVSPQDVVVQTTYEVEIESVKGTLHVIIPYASIEPLKGRLSSGVMGEAREVDALWITRLTEQLMTTPVRVRAELGTAQMDLRDLMKLQPGDVIALDEKASSPVNVEVEGSLRYRARPVVSGGHLGVEVVERLPQMLEVPGDIGPGGKKKKPQRTLTAGGA
jgi:flagellar motor switch protein FliM